MSVGRRPVSQHYWYKVPVLHIIKYPLISASSPSFIYFVQIEPHIYMYIHIYTYKRISVYIRVLFFESYMHIFTILEQICIPKNWFETEKVKKRYRQCVCVCEISAVCVCVCVCVGVDVYPCPARLVGGRGRFYSALVE